MLLIKKEFIAIWIIFLYDVTKVKGTKFGSSFNSFNPLVLKFTESKFYGWQKELRFVGIKFYELKEIKKVIQTNFRNLYHKQIKML